MLCSRHTDLENGHVRMAVHEAQKIEVSVSPPLLTSNSPTTVTKGEGTTLAPNTTEADDKVTEGQRRVNLVWEGSQSVISIAITAAVIYCQIHGITSETLNNAFFFVVATYLQRTNHIRQGGVPPDASRQPYTGR